jgi:hypothetical protein
MEWAGAGREFGARSSRAFFLAVVSLTVLSVFAPAAQAAPVNDDFRLAIALPSALPTFTLGENLSATKQQGEPAHAGNVGGHSVWFSWTPGSSGPVGISASGCPVGSPIDTLLAVYTATGPSFADLTAVASNDDAAADPCGLGGSEVVFSATAGTPYLIAVDGKSGSEGLFHLEMQGPPPGDAFAQPQTLGAVLPSSSFTTNNLATKELGEPNHAGDPGGHSVWFSWTPSSNSPVKISTCSGQALDTLLAVYTATGPSFADLTAVASNDDGDSPACNGGSEVRFTATAATTYLIAVDGKGGAQGTFELRLSGRPPNDALANATPIVSTPPLAEFGTNELASKELGEPNHAGVPGGHSVWFKWTPSSTGVVGIAACAPSSLDTLLAVYTATGPGPVPSFGELTPVASNDDGDDHGCNGVSSETEFLAAAGTVYLIAVDGKDGSEGEFSLAIEPGPANDARADAQEVPADPPDEIFATNRLASKELGEPNHAGDPGGHSVWFKWTPDESGPVGVDTCSFNDFDTLLAVYTATGPSFADLTEVASNDDGDDRACGGAASEAEFFAAAGTTYLIAVDGKNGGQRGFTLHLVTRPGNDDLDDALPIGATLPEGLSASTRFATKETGEPDHAGDPGGHSVWFKWTPDESGPVDISTCANADDFDTLLAVYTDTGPSFADLTEVASNDDAASFVCSLSDSEVRFDAVAGETYSIAVDGASDTAGSFELLLEGRPANDSLGDAEVLDPGLPAFSSRATTRLATKQPGEPDHAGVPGGHSVWFTWTPAQSGPVSADACPANGLDPVLAVYTATGPAPVPSFEDLTEVASNDDAAEDPCFLGASRVVFTATAGTTYLIAVDGSGDEGQFRLTLEGPSPPNDQLSDAEVLPPDFPTGASGTTRLATKELGEPNHAGVPGGHSVWFSWTPTESGPVSVDACSGGDTLLAVYTAAGPSFADLTEVASNDDGDLRACGGATSETEFLATAGTTYLIAVDGTEADFGLNLDGEPSNDDFASAEALSAQPSRTLFSTTRFATKEPGEPNHAGVPGGHSVWFKWTPDKDATVSISACSFGGELDRVSGDFDPVLAVYTATGPAPVPSFGELTPVASNDDASSPSCSATEGEVQFDAVAGTTYRIAVDGKAGAGSFLFRMANRPANDDFATPELLSPVPPDFVGTVTNRFATKEQDEPDHAGNPGGHSTWFSWTPKKTGPAIVEICAFSGFDSLLAVYTGSAVDNLTPVAGNDDGSPSTCSTGSVAEFVATAGKTYRIAVDGKAGGVGRFRLALEGPPLNDDLSKAQALGGGASGEGSSSNHFATKQPGEPEHAGEPGGHSVWFKWTAPRSGPFSLDTCLSDFEIDTVLAVYTGTAVNNLTPVAGNDDGGGSCAPRSRLTFDAVSGTTYRIAVDSRDGADGSIALSIAARPSNDDLAAARRLSHFFEQGIEGSTRLATKQPGEPNHAAPGGHSVWYSWSPTKSGPVRVRACSFGALDTLLAVYTGSAVDNLTPVAANDEAPTLRCGEGESEVEFFALAGTNYLMAVDGVGGEEGRFQLEMESPIQRSLSIHTVGSGRVGSQPAGIDCGAACSDDFPRGRAITLTATPAAGFRFAGWSGGGCSGAGACQILLKDNTQVTATFVVPPPPPLPPPPPPPPHKPPPHKPRPHKPLKCKRGFVKKKVHGKVRCVRKRKARH